MSYSNICLFLRLITLYFEDTILFIITDFLLLMLVQEKQGRFIAIPAGRQFELVF